MKKKLGLLPVALLTALLPVWPSSAGASMPYANSNDTCFGEKATVIQPSGTTKIGNLVYNVYQGTPGADVIIGTDGLDIIVGNGGADTICARGGNDFVRLDLRTNDPDNTFDHVDLGYGNDSLDPLSDGPAAVLAIGGPGVDNLTGGQGNDFLETGTNVDADRPSVPASFSTDGGGGFDSCTSVSAMGSYRSCENGWNRPPSDGVYQPNYRKAAITTTTSAPPATTTTRPPTVTTTRGTVTTTTGPTPVTTGPPVTTTIGPR
jgi:Ca2+-binding RTX toxin-like protein